MALDKESNKVTLTYSNDPYDETSFGFDSGFADCYTFSLEVFKTDTSLTTPLEGAVFELWVNPYDDTAEEYQVYLMRSEDDPTVYTVS